MGDEPLGLLDHQPRAAVADREGQALAVELGRDPVHGLAVRAPEAIDRLVRIADRDEAGAGLEHPAKHGALDGRHVLGLVHEHPVILEERGARDDRHVEHVIEVDGLSGRQDALQERLLGEADRRHQVVADDGVMVRQGLPVLVGVLHEAGGTGRRGALGHEARALGQADQLLGDAEDVQAGVVPIPALGEALHDPVDLVAVHEGAARLAASPGRHAHGVERAGLDMLGEALLQLLGDGLVEGQEHAGGVLGEEVRGLHDRGGLARARDGLDQGRALAVRHEVQDGLLILVR